MIRTKSQSRYPLFTVWYFYYLFCLHFRDFFLVAQDALMKTKSIISLIWLPHSETKTLLWKFIIRDPLLLSHGQWPSIILCFFSISCSISKITLYNPTYGRGKLQGFCYQNFPITDLIPPWAAPLKTGTHVYTRTMYVHALICLSICCLFAMVLKTCSFIALTALGYRLCSLPRHFSLLFPPGDSSLLHLPVIFRSQLTWPYAYSAFQDIHAARASHHVGSIPPRSQHGRPGDDNPVVHFFKNIVSLFSSCYALKQNVFL